MILAHKYTVVFAALDFSDWTNIDSNTCRTPWRNAGVMLGKDGWLWINIAPMCALEHLVNKQFWAILVRRKIEKKAPDRPRKWSSPRLCRRHGDVGFGGLCYLAGGRPLADSFSFSSIQGPARTCGWPRSLESMRGPRVWQGGPRV